MSDPAGDRHAHRPEPARGPAGPAPQRGARGTGLIIGATGFLGRRLVAVAAQEHLATVAVGSRRLDVTDPVAVAELVQRLRPTWVVNAAATNPGRGDEATMWAVNAHGAATVARAAATIGARLVHVSTDLVHDGTAAPYGDDAPARPGPGAYGASKAAGEAAVLVEHPGAAVVRTSLLFDPAAPDRATAAWQTALAEGAPVRLFADCFRQPACAPDLARALIRLAREHTEANGTLNLTGDEVLTRADHARRLLAWFAVRGVEAAQDVPTPQGVPRDLRLRLDRAGHLGLVVRGPRAALRPSGP